LLVSVAFFTLLERKVLAYIMVRRGPNKPGLCGFIVPFADALKLLSKPLLIPSTSRPFLMHFAIFNIFAVPSILWIFIILPSTVWSWAHSLLSVLVWLSLSVYALLAAGWGSNSKYSTLGGTRSIATCISYEVCLTLLLISLCLLSSFNIFVTKTHCGLLLYPHLVLILFVVVLAESNRSPFDFAEGESELVSGYNVEFSGPGFVVLFLSEYLSILFLSFLTGSVACDASYFNSLLFCLGFAFSFVWARGTLPRFRYDQLMALS
jgi:NADH-ubiquinone oxidoreductase chain 1